MEKLFLFSLGWCFVIYIINCFFAKQLIIPDFKKAFVYMGGVALIGPIGEVFINTIYHAVTGGYLWEYRLFPIHDAQTSLYSIFIWSLYGFHLYLYQNFTLKKPYPEWVLSVIIAVEAIVLEILVNISSIVFFKNYIFYYFPSDLWHMSTLAAFPFYVLAGFVIIKSIRRFKSDPIFFGVMSYLITFVFCFLV